MYVNMAKAKQKKTPPKSVLGSCNYCRPSDTTSRLRLHGHSKPLMVGLKKKRTITGIATQKKMCLITSLQCFLFSPGPKQWYLSRFYRFGA